MEPEKKTTNDWCDSGSRLGFKGKEYFLQELVDEELIALDMEIKEDMALLKEIRRREDLNNEERVDLMKLIYLRKRQVNMIVADFVRRKKNVKPLEAFAFAAVYDLLGKSALDQVKERCRELQELDRLENNPFSVKHGLLIPPEAYKKEKMCGPDDKPKVKHPTAYAAQLHIEGLKKVKQDVKGLNVYGPCPFCGFYHIGHMPEKYLWMKEQEKRRKKEKRPNGGEPTST